MILRPLISIITVVYNDLKGIENTILSVLSQQSDNFEYIIVDGNSSDGTSKVIKSYAHGVDIIISEPDGGLYDAMNKGVRSANGRWIYFLNSSDHFLNPNTINKVEPYLNEDCDVVHFNCRVSNNKGNFVHVRRYPKDIHEIANWPCIQHQSVFTKKSVFDSVCGFNLNYEILADYDFFLRLYLQKKSSVFIKIFISQIIIHKASRHRNTILVSYEMNYVQSS